MSVHLDYTVLGSWIQESGLDRLLSHRPQKTDPGLDCFWSGEQYIAVRARFKVLGIRLGLQESCRSSKETVPTFILDQNRSIRSIISQVSNLIEAER